MSSFLPVRAVLRGVRESERAARKVDVAPTEGKAVPQPQAREIAKQDDAAPIVGWWNRN
jgi:hypothetical protein